MQPNRFKAAITSGERQVGLWMSLSSGYAADVVGDIGYDWLLVDTEHSPSDIATVLSQLQAVEPGGATAIVRPAWNDTVLIKRILDIGARGVLIPMVQSPEEAAAAVAACRYPPRGVRGVSMGMRGSRFGRDKEYFAKADDEIVVLVQVETQEALDRVEEIAAVDGVDGVFFGPADIAASLGQLGNILNDELWQVILEAAAKVQAMGKPTGTLIGDTSRVKQCFDAGMSFVACGSDLNLMARAAEALLVKVREG